MPIIVALTIRSIIQMAVTLGLVELASRTLLPLLNSAIAAVAKTFGATEEEAKDIIANEFLQFAEQVGVGVLVLRAKLPTTIAERLGFTSKGWGKRPIKPTIAAHIINTPGGGTLNLTTGVATTAATASATLSAAKSALPGAATALKFLEGRLNFLFLGALVFANFIDFGNWTTGAYSDTFQKLFEKISFGLLKPNEDYRQTRTASPEVFVKIYNTYKLEGATAIKDNFKQQTVAFTRDALIDLIDKIGAGLLHHTGTATTKDVLLATQLMIVFKMQTTAMPSAPSGSLAGSPAPLPSGATSPTLFVGHINAGQLSAVKSFTPEMRERITTPEEMTAAVQDNIAGFLSALPGMIVVNIVLKDNVFTPDGEQLIGTMGKVQTSVSKTGKPHFRRFRNSFVVAQISVLRNTGGRTTIGEIVVGPLDESMVDPTPEQLVALGNALSKKMITTSMAGVSSVAIAPNEVTLPSGLKVQINAQGDIISPAMAGPVVMVSETDKSAQPPTPAEPVAAPTPSTTMEQPPTTPSGLTLEQALAIQATALRKESLNAWEEIAVQKHTQFNFVLPDGVKIRAGINPDQAATINIGELLLAGGAFYAPREFANEVIRQWHMAGKEMDRGFFNQDLGV